MKNSGLDPSFLLITSARSFKHSGGGKFQLPDFAFLLPRAYRLGPHASAARRPIPSNRVNASDQQRNRAMVRSVLAYWSVKELGMTAFAVAERLGLSPSAASRCVQRGERIAAGDELVL